MPPNPTLLGIIHPWLCRRRPGCRPARGIQRHIQFEADPVDQLFNSRLLLLLANFGKPGALESVFPHDLSVARVGTTRFRINSFMNKFRKLGRTECNDHPRSALLPVVVHD
jgi:CRP/FNR family transcriptional regulator, cyclic AMP receptor protein